MMENTLPEPKTIRTIDVVGLCLCSMVLGWAIGLMTNADISYYAGKLNARQQAKEDAMRWAKEELRRSCPSWYTDRRQDRFMACNKPEWMK